MGRAVDIPGGYSSTEIVASKSNSADPGLIGDGSNKLAPPAAGAAEQTAQPRSRRSHDGGLLLIGLFKLAKAIFFFSIGIGAFHLLHRDLDEEVMRFALVVHRWDPEGRLVNLLLEKVGMIDPHRLRMIGLGTFAYSAIALTEGIGLLYEMPWAEYLTLTLTASFLPWELYELFRRPDWLRAGLLLINLAVLGYLVWLVQRKKSRVEASETG
jgi:uncharacterized membrane protein (DUF2068 family)